MNSTIQISTMLSHFDKLYQMIMSSLSTYVPATSSGSIIGGSFSDYFTTPKKYICEHRFLL